MLAKTKKIQQEKKKLFITSALGFSPSLHSLSFDVFVE